MPHMRSGTCFTPVAITRAPSVASPGPLTSCVQRLSSRNVHEGRAVRAGDPNPPTHRHVASTHQLSFAQLSRRWRRTLVFPPVPATCLDSSPVHNYARPSQLPTRHGGKQVLTVSQQLSLPPRASIVSQVTVASTRRLHNLLATASAPSRHHAHGATPIPTCAFHCTNKMYGRHARYRDATLSTNRMS